MRASGVTPVSGLTLIVALVALTLVAAGGCNRGPGAGESAESAELEHHIPEHRPPNFPAALPQIRSRLARVQEEMSHEHGETALMHDEFTKLQDVVRWLPEIAADSDLPEPEWNQIRDASSELERLLETLHEGRHSRRGTDTAAVTAELEEVLKRLEPFVEHDAFRMHVAVQEEDVAEEMNAN